MPPDQDAKSTPPALLAVSEAKQRILDGVGITASETVSYADALGRTLAMPVHAKASVPAFDLSAMDGYAVRSEDVKTLPARLTRCGESAAGHPFAGKVGRGEAVRIFTGAKVPDDADVIILQEDVDAASEENGITITIKSGNPAGKHIRRKGLDMEKDAPVLNAGQHLSARAISLCLSAGHTDLEVYKQPRIGILSTGDELVPPGTTPAKGQIVSSNAQYLAHFVEMNGGVPINLGIVRDEAGALAQALKADNDLDLIVTSGGASVGVHDHIAGDLDGADQSVDTAHQTRIHFWKIAMRPGKPVIFGKINNIPLLGLPGNPVSSAICAMIFLTPALAHMQGRHHQDMTFHATLASDLRDNDKRQEYLRATLTYDAAGRAIVTPANLQDSSMLSVLANADVLIMRPPFDPARRAGDQVTVLPIPRLF
ncbi:molybdopterin molybdotransferase MoeA [Candidatus Puniceispirillum sp.]|uniref:molybdopterin molybdotransferase MoeA n=1 Tax=Candidatus Puniceispirillum sp. TaxID=2026719 RepID=UPI003F6A3AEA